MKFLFSFLILSGMLSACSIYQSDGRKFLEKQAFEYAGVQAQENLLGCRQAPGVHGFNLFHSEARALIFRSEMKPLEIRVVPLGHRPYGCDYGFANEEELNADLTPAIELTLRQLQGSPTP